MKQPTMYSIMTTEVDCLAPGDTLQTAMEHVVTHLRSCMIIVDSKNKPLGILTERRLLHTIAETADYNNLMTQKCTDHMHEAVKVHESTTLVKALELKNSLNAKHLVVVDRDGQLMGLITQTDLISSYAEMIEKTKDHLEKTVLKRTQELENVNRKLASMSLIDPLTGLGNRRAMQVDIMKTHAASIRHDKPYTVALLDIDYFKKYNDHYGHQKGDKVLQDVAHSFKESIRSTDFLYRYGGEEFLVLMPETSAQEAKILMARIVGDLAKLKIEHTKSPMQVVTTSAGAAESASSPKRLTTWRQVIEIADKCLYKSKESGRNTYSIAESNLPQVANSN